MPRMDVAPASKRPAPWISISITLEAYEAIRLTKPSKEGIPRPIMIWPRDNAFTTACGAEGVAGTIPCYRRPSPANRFFEGGGIASRSLDGSA